LIFCLALTLFLFCFSTDVWALGCCLYSLAFLQNCFEEGSNLAILSRNYKIPEDNPYGEGLVELIDRMLTVDCKVRADMTEVILCLSAIYSGRPLPPRKKSPKAKKEQGEGSESNSECEKPRGTYRTDGQGIRNTPKPIETKKPAEVRSCHLSVIVLIVRLAVKRV
jgi:serine/threonine protein kinase